MTCPIFRKTITLDANEHKLMVAYVQAHIMVVLEDIEQGKDRPIDEQTLPVFESILIKLTSPSSVFDPGQN